MNKGMRMGHTTKSRYLSSGKNFNKKIKFHETKI